jgi:ABC-type dipeptide/oligopeptide/nickel transport system ATPase component
VRLRKLEISTGEQRITIDTRNSGSVPLQALAIVGGNGVGKSLCMQVALRVFQSTAQDNHQPTLFTKNIQATVEFEYQGGIHVGVIKDGVLIQKPSASGMLIEPRKLTDGCLFYDVKMRINALDSNNTSIGMAFTTMLLQDFYYNQIKNSLVWIDDFDLGLDSENARVLLQVALRKCLERDNQLIVTTRNRELVELLGQDSIRVLSSGVRYVDRAMKNIK